MATSTGANTPTPTPTPTVNAGAAKFQEAIGQLQSCLITMGFDLEDENFIGTPERFLRYLMEYTVPFEPVEVLKADFSNEHHIDAGYRGMLVQHNIPFRTICPHHLLPVTGVAHIGYIPSKKLVGLSKLTRLVEAVGHEQPRMQETITDLIADILAEQLEAKGVMVVITASHGCMEGRGVKVHDTPTTTSTVRGLFRDVSIARQEFFDLLKIIK